VPKLKSFGFNVTEGRSVRWRLVDKHEVQLLGRIVRERHQAMLLTIIMPGRVRRKPVRNRTRSLRRFRRSFSVWAVAKDEACEPDLNCHRRIQKRTPQVRRARQDHPRLGQPKIGWGLRAIA
jgi:hypothetical protein